jgi:outer membrane protein OmpA-like peptidoglycan-associated protein
MVVSWSRLLLVGLSLTSAVVTAGCNRERRQAESLLAESSNSYDRLQPKCAQLRATLGDMRQDVEDLAEIVPGGADLRAKYFSADEVLGVLDAKMKWLAAEIQSAKHDPRLERVVGLQNELAHTASDMRQVSSFAVELTHEKARLQRIAALLKAPYEHKLASGYRVKAAKDGLESHIIDFIEDPHKKADKTSWFDFDRIDFARDAATLDIPRSRSQLENVAQILKAYPTVKVKIGGHVASKGKVGASHRLSAQLAEAVRKALVRSGVNPHRLEAEGYGSQHPACNANESQDCKARGRRIAALVTAK